MVKIDKKIKIIMMMMNDEEDDVVMMDNNNYHIILFIKEQQLKIKNKKNHNMYGKNSINLLYFRPMINFYE